MATQTQYDVFKYIHDEETRRLSELVTRAKVYLSIATFFLGALGYKAGDPILVGSRAAQVVFLLAALCFLVAFVLIILALRIFSYEGLCDPAEVINEFQDNPPDDEAFLDDRIVDLAVACNRNSSYNDRRARLLQISSLAMVAGVVLSLVAIALGTWVTSAAIPGTK